MLRFRPLNKSESRLKLGLPLEAKIVLFPATPNREEKGFNLAKEAFMLFAKSCRGALMLVGGQIDYDIVPLCVNACDALLLTSESEAFPMIVKEALCCNVPVVTTDVGEVKALFGNLKGCLICEPEPKLIASALSEACSLGHINSRRQIAHLGSEKDSVAKRIIHIHKSLMEEETNENLGSPRRSQRLRLSFGRWKDPPCHSGGEINQNKKSRPFSACGHKGDP